MVSEQAPQAGKFGGAAGKKRRKSERGERRREASRVCFSHNIGSRVRFGHNTGSAPAPSFSMRGDCQLPASWLAIAGTSAALGHLAVLLGARARARVPVPVPVPVHGTRLGTRSPEP